MTTAGTTPGRIARYHAACMLAQLILEDAEGNDTRNVAQAFADVRDEVLAGRRNQVEWPVVAARVLALLEQKTPDRHLRVVE